MVPTLVVAVDKAGLVKQAEVLAFLEGLQRLVIDHVRVTDSSRNIALKAGRSGWDSCITWDSLDLLQESRATAELTSLRRGFHISGCESDCSLGRVRNLSGVNSICVYGSFNVDSSGRGDAGKANRAKDRLHIVVVIVTRCKRG